MGEPERRLPKRSQCGKKQRHKTQAAAEAHADHLWQTTGDLVRAYQCPHCLCYHIGHFNPLKKAG